MNSLRNRPNSQFCDREPFSVIRRGTRSYFYTVLLQCSYFLPFISGTFGVDKEAPVVPLRFRSSNWTSLKRLCLWLRVMFNIRSIVKYGQVLVFTASFQEIPFWAFKNIISWYQTILCQFYNYQCQHIKSISLPFCNYITDRFRL